MNCPESTYVYRQALRSYRDLPIRLAEMGRLHRNERSGTLTGLFRVRQFTQDDAHIYCRPDQLQAEIAGVIELVRVLPDVRARAVLQARHAARPVPRHDRAGQGGGGPGGGAQEPWTGLRRQAQGRKLLRAQDRHHIEDVLGRDWQLATVQADLTMLPERFQLEYVDTDGKAKRPVAIHRAIFGSFERFIGILTEHFAGAFPTWLAPVQARVLPVSAKHAEYGTVHRRLLDAGVRAELDDRSEKLGYKVREAQVQKVPYVVVGSARPARAPRAFAREAARTSGRCPSTGSSPRSRPRSGPGP